MAAGTFTPLAGHLLTAECHCGCREDGPVGWIVLLKVLDGRHPLVLVLGRAAGQQIRFGSTERAQLEGMRADVDDGQRFQHFHILDSQPILVDEATALNQLFLANHQLLVEQEQSHFPRPPVRRDLEQFALMDQPAVERRYVAPLSVELS